MKDLTPHQIDIVLDTLEEQAAALAAEIAALKLETSTSEP